MTVAADARILKQRMDYYVWRDRAPRNEQLRAVLRDNFFQFDRVGIVGGMVRDFARVGRRGFNSDVDLVIDASVAAVAELAKAEGARANSFGGYSFERAGWKFDFWALETTWAAREGHAHATHLEDITRCTFFDWDAIVYDLKERRVYCRESYFDDIRNRVLEISVPETPAILGNLYRAVRRILQWQLVPGPKLAAFIAAHLDDKGFQSVVRQDRILNPAPFLAAFERAEILRDSVLSNTRRANSPLMV